MPGIGNRSKVDGVHQVAQDGDPQILLLKPYDNAMTAIPLQPDMFAGTTQLHLLMRTNDWSASPLGCPHGWPVELRTIVDLVLNSKFPMFVAWGPDLGFIYNDAYTQFLGQKHPSALGKRFKEVWLEIWSDIYPLIQKALAGESTYAEDMPLRILRGGRGEPAWFTFSYSPVLRQDGAVAGLYCAVTETTARVWSERRQAFQLEIADRLRGMAEAAAIMAGASQLIGRHLQARRVAFAEVDRTNRDAAFHPGYGDGSVPELAGAISDSALAEGFEQLTTGTTLPQLEKRSPGQSNRAIRTVGLTTVIASSDLVLPVLRGGKLHAVLAIENGAPREWAAEEIALVQDAAERVWSAVERTRAEAALRDSEASLRRLALTLENDVAERTRERDRIWRNSMDLLLVVDPGGFLRAVNPAWTAILGYQPEDLVGFHFAPFVHPDDIAPTVDAISKASQGPLTNFEVRVKHKDGSYRWFEWRAAPDQGMVYANGRDITVEKRQAEQLLQANRARLNLALQAGEMGAWEWNANLNTVRWLQGMAAVHGLPAADAPTEFSLRDYVRRFVHMEDRRVVSDGIGNALPGDENRRVEYRIVWPDGTVHWIEARGQMFHDDQGRPSQMVGVSINVTRRKRAEQDLKFLAEASAELARLVEPAITLERLAFLAVPSFADWCAIDLWQEDGTLERVAVAHVKPEKVQLGYALHRRLPSRARSASGPPGTRETEAPELVRELSAEMLETAISDPDLVAALKELGLRSWMRVPVSAHGEALGELSFVAAESGRLYEPEDLALAEDLARRVAVALENASLYRAMRKSDHAKDIFLATLSHELRSPLAAVVNGLSLTMLASDDRARVKNYTALMQRQAAHLTRLVDDLMDVSRITTGKIELKKEPATLASVLQGAVDTSRPDIEAGNHRLVIKLPDGPTDILADPVRLAQVFSNLLSNAAKYTEPGGEIRLSLNSTASEYVVCVRDSGVGIPPEMLQNIFKLFTQATHPIDRQGGLGIGLSLVEGLVRLHGGTVEAFSAGIGHGSEFLVRLPREAVCTATPALAFNSKNVAPPTGETRRVLVVDDNVDAASTVAEILRMVGHEVQTAHDGLSAVAMAQSMKPDVILLDIGLPGIDGYEVARRIRASDSPVNDAALVALTGWGEDEDVQRAFSVGFDDHCVKPVGLDRLVEVVQGTHRRAA
jgi:PAS domain S-box-containing protein